MLFKKYVEKKRQKAEELQREKEMQAKASIRRTLTKMRSQSKKLEPLKAECIAKGNKALLNNDQESYKLQRNALKICLSKQRYLDNMIAHFEISMQYNDMGHIIKEFASGVSLITEELKSVAQGNELDKIQEDFMTAISANTTGFDALDSYLQTASDSLDSIDFGNANVSDEEIDRLMSNQVIDKESQLDREIDSSIDLLNKQIKESI